MNRLPFVVALTLLSSGCGRSDHEPAPPSVAVRPPSSAQPTLEQWLPEGTAPENTGHAQASPHAQPSPHGGSIPGSAGMEPRAQPAMPGLGGMVRGTVTETMDSGGYTYLLVDTTDGPIWVAASQREVIVGTTVQASGAVMPSFRSNTLNRTFEQLMLASSVEVIPAR